MKKGFSLVVLLVLSSVLGGCFDKIPEKTETQPTPSHAPVAIPEQNISTETSATPPIEQSPNVPVVQNVEQPIQKTYTSISDCISLQSSEADKCYSEVSKFTKNDALCTKISETSMKNVCYLDVATVTSQGDSCDKIQEVAIRDACYMMITSNTKKFELCDKIQDKNMKSSCLANKANAKK